MANQHFSVEALLIPLPTYLYPQRMANRTDIRVDGASRAPRQQPCVAACLQLPRLRKCILRPRCCPRQKPFLRLGGCARTQLIHRFAMRLQLSPLHTHKPPMRTSRAGHDCSYFDNVRTIADYGQRNKETLAQLLYAFFEYWRAVLAPRPCRSPPARWRFRPEDGAPMQLAGETFVRAAVAGIPAVSLTHRPPQKTFPAGLCCTITE